MAEEGTSERRFDVIIPVDHSSQAEEAFHWYADTLHKPSNHVTLVHVPEHPTVHSTKGMRLNEGDIQKMIAQEKLETQEMVTKYSQKLVEHKMQGDYRTVYAERHSKTGEAIIQAVTDLRADMVIMGTRGMGSVRRTIMGSVSDYVVHHSHVPVIVYRK